MKNFRLMLLGLISISMVSAAGACKKDEPVINDRVSTDKIKVIVGATTFSATLYDNATAAAFKALLPFTVQMADLNSNEKFVDLPSGLPAQATRAGSIRNGDIMLYGSRTLVLFYESFSSNYTYTRIGILDDVSGYKAALGAGNVTVKFELQ